MNNLPQSVPYLIIGAGVHGLSTGYHLAQKLKAQGKGDGSDILIVDKTGVAAGASGIACGVIRNNYYQPAMRELMAHSVEAWEKDPQAYHYHPVGYMQISPEAMREDVASIHEQQKAIGYESEFIAGAADSDRYMKSLFHDWQAQGITSVLHEKPGGYANSKASMLGLADKARQAGVQILSGVKITGFQRAGDGSIQAVHTNCGTIHTDYVILGVGPWINTFWNLLDLPATITIQDSGHTQPNVRMWQFWCLQEGTLGVDPDMLKTNDGQTPPVLHVDTDAPLHDEQGQLITDQMWGIYFKPDFRFGGVQGGAVPYRVETDADQVAVDPYGPDSPDFVVGSDFRRMWTSALSFCLKRFEGTSYLYKDEPSGGIGCLSPDSFPIFDVFCHNCYIIADANHGYKMLGVGDLVAQEIMGHTSALLEPFRFSRFDQGKLHPVSNSPFPWS